MFYNVKNAFRNLSRNGLYSILNIAGLSVGIAAAMLIFLWASFHLHFNRSFPNAENIYEVGVKQRYGDQIHTFFVASGPLSKVLEESFPEIRRNARVGTTWGNFKLEDTEQFLSGYGCCIDSTIFAMLQMEFVRGNPETAFTSDYSVVISEKMAKRYFDDEDPIGKVLQIQIGEDTRYEITGVYKDLDKNSSFSYEWMIPFHIWEVKNASDNWGDMDDWGNYWMNMFVEIVPDADVDNINQKLKTLIAEKTGSESNFEIFIYPVTRQQLYIFQNGQEVSGYISTIRLFLAIGGIILLIACINFMNLSTARSQKRTIEVGVRKTFGARRLTLIGQFIGEAGAVTFVALLIAVGLVLLCLPYFSKLVSINLTFDFYDWNHWAGLVVIGLICSLLSGSYPAFYLSSFPPMTIFQRLKIKTVGSVVWIRKGLVVFQFATSFVLICATLVIFLQIRHGKMRDIGFDKENVVTYPVTGNIKESYVAVQNELITSGIVENAGMFSHPLYQIWSNGGGRNWQGKDPEADILISLCSTSPGLIETVKLTIEEGRDFSVEDEGKNYIIINRSLANLMGEAGHIGGHIFGEENISESYLEIIGIVNDFVFNRIFQTTPDPLIIYYDKEWFNFLFVRLKPDVKTDKSLEQIEGILKKFSPNQQFNATFMDDSFNQLFNQLFTEQKFSLLFAFLAVFISCLGLFGLSSFSAEQRKKEIGIRKVMGADVRTLVNMLISNFFVLIGISFIIAIPIAWYIIHRWLADFQYRIAESWLLFVVVGVLIIIIVLLTVGFQALRAATTDPIKSISSSE